MSNKERVDEPECSSPAVSCDGWWDHWSADHQSLQQDTAQTVTMCSRCAAIAAGPVHILRAASPSASSLDCRSRVCGKPRVLANVITSRLDRAWFCKLQYKESRAWAAHLCQHISMIRAICHYVNVKGELLWDMADHSRGISRGKSLDKKT